MSVSGELKKLKYIGDVPMVYKHAAYEIFYEPLYVQLVGDKPFFAIKTDDAVEAIAKCKVGKMQLLGKEYFFEYNAENSNVCVNIPEYTF